MSTAGVVTGSVPVNIDTYPRAESDHYFKAKADEGYFGTIGHIRQPAAIDHQLVIRVNRDTLFSYGVFDLTEPVTITLPDSEGRFLSLVAISQDHYIKLVAYDAGSYELTREHVGTRYVQVAIRTFVDANDPADVAAANRLQDKIGAHQTAVGVLELPDWGQDQLAAIRAAVLGLGRFVPNSHGMFGDQTETTEVRHLIGTAGGFGGNRLQDAIYLNVTPAGNDGTQAFTLTVPDVPVEAFWSISVYNATGYFEPNPHDAYSLNNVTASHDAGGTVTIRFGGDPDQPNYLAITPGWNYTVRMYRPKPELVSGTWTFPQPVPA